MLKPGHSQELELSFNLESIASYDDSGISGFEFSFVLEEGKYFVFMGTDSENAKKIPLGSSDCISLEKLTLRKNFVRRLLQEKLFQESSLHK